MMFKIIIIVMLLMCFTGALMQQQGIESEEFYNTTSLVSYDNLNLTSITDIGDDVNESFMVRTVGKYADFILFATVEGTRVSMEFGYENPEYDFDFAWRVLFISCFAVLIILLLYVLLFVGYGIYNIKEWIVKRKKR